MICDGGFMYNVKEDLRMALVWWFKFIDFFLVFQESDSKRTTCFT